MGKIFLIIVFIAGLFISIENWKYAVQSLFELTEILKRGYHPSDYPDCICDACKKNSDEERLNHKIENYNADVSLIKKSLIGAITDSIFSSGITLIILYIILN